MDFQNCLIVPASKRSCETGRPPFLASGSRRRGAGSACSSGSRSKIKTQRARTQSRDRSSEVKRAVSEARGSKEQRQHAMTQRDRGPGLHMDEHERVREQCKGMTQKEESPSEDASGIAAASPCMWRLIQGGRLARWNGSSGERRARWWCPPQLLKAAMPATCASRPPAGTSLNL